MNLELEKIFKENKIKNIVIDSRKVKHGDLFVALTGSNVDSHSFVYDAVKKGAVVLVLEKDVPDIPNNIKKIIVKNTREILSNLSNICYDYPFNKIFTIGVTGTNGKTTTTYLIESILNQNNFPSAVIGTIEYRLGKEKFPSKNTTPGPPFLQMLGVKMLKQKIHHCVMEVSSHSLVQNRVSGIPFKAGIFTNLGKDHLEYHGSVLEYLKAKQILFKNLDKDGIAIINKDDEKFEYLKNSTCAKVYGYSIDKKSDIFCKEYNKDGVLICYPNNQILIKTKLIGKHNVYNILSAFALTYFMGIDVNVIKIGLEKINFIPGRLEHINYNDIEIYIDYAHTPDALEAVLMSLKNFSKKRIILVFGCGGNRDKSKRLQMGKIACKLADFSFITNDNPRYEDSAIIAESIKQGFNNDKKYKIIYNRKDAICEALNFAKQGDIVLVAGKGHEVYQEINGKCYDFNDKNIIKYYLNMDTDKN